MKYYAQITDENIAFAISDLCGDVTQENLIPITKDEYETSYVLGKKYDKVLNTWLDVPPPPPAPTWVITRNALQNRFPLTANGVSTKYDLATLFLNDSGYAASLGVTGSDLYSLRSLLITANNRLGVVSNVDLKAQETVDYVTMMTNAAFPDVFRLTQAEADAILNTPAASNETP